MDPAGEVALGLLTALILIVALAPQVVDLLGVSGPNVRHPGTLAALGTPTGPSAAHPFGVDEMGRDLLARVIYGLRSSFEVGAMGAAIAAAVGAVVGLIAGLSNRWIDALLMGVADVVIAFPAIVLGFGVAGACRGGCVSGLIKPGMTTVVLVIALSGFPYIARIVRGRVRSRTPGSRGVRLLAELAAYAALLIPISMLLEAGLSFLGIGLRPPTVSLGQMISGAGAEVLSGGRTWWYLVFPGVGLLLAVITVRLVGNRLLRVPEPPAAPPTPHRERQRRDTGRYVARRLARAIVLSLLITAATFVIFSVLPSSGPNRGSVEHFWHVLRLAFGTSTIIDHVPPTLSVVSGAIVVSAILAIPLGLLWAISRRRIVDGAARATALTAWSIPVFWLALGCIYLFSTQVGVAPALDGPSTYRGLTSSPGRWFGSLLLPWLVLAVSFVAFYGQVMRANLLEAMSEGFILTARAKGLRPRRVVLRHGMRAALPALLPVFDLGLGPLLGAVVLVETVFNIPGLGRLAYDRVARGDLPVLEGTVLFAALLIVIARLIVDVAYAFSDPRVRHQ